MATRALAPRRAPRDKRADLVGAATLLVREQGLARTTLADVADRAGVPLGNVYYYFKTKEALAEAVIAAHEAALAELFASFETDSPDPLERLRALVRAPLHDPGGVIQFGCPHGSLCQELEKLGPDAPLARAGARLLLVYVDWAQAQFRALGIRKGDARARALGLVAAMQGAMLLAHSFRSERILRGQLRRLELQLDRARSE